MQFSKMVAPSGSQRQMYGLLLLVNGRIIDGVQPERLDHSNRLFEFIWPRRFRDAGVRVFQIRVAESVVGNRSGRNDDRDVPVIRVRFQPLQDLRAVHVGKVPVEKDEIRPWSVSVFATLINEVERISPRGDGKE